MSSTTGPGVLYFAYASLLYEDRVKNCAPSAVRHCVGKLEGYKLVFNKYSPKWSGGMAQGTASPGDHIWGVVWRITEEERQSVYKQEGISKGVFEVKDITVTTEAGDTVPCFFIFSPQTPVELAKPSPVYKMVIVEGAKQGGLPDYYIRQLKAIEDNGYMYTGEAGDIAKGDNF